MDLSVLPVQGYLGHVKNQLVYRLLSGLACYSSINNDSDRGLGRTVRQKNRCLWLGMGLAINE